MSQFMRELLIAKGGSVKPRLDYRDDLSTDVDCSLVCEDASLTKQSEAAACDVNNIVKHWIQSGGAMDLSQRVGQFLDVSAVPDFRSCQQFLIDAENMFLSIPADVRARFNNDPAVFLDFVQNPANSDELVKLGLATAKSLAAGAALAGSASAPEAGGASKDAPIASGDAPK